MHIHVADDIMYHRTNRGNDATFADVSLHGIHGGCVLCVVVCKSLSSVCKPLASVCKPLESVCKLFPWFANTRKHSWLDVLAFAYPRSFHINANRNVKFFCKNRQCFKKHCDGLQIIAKLTVVWKPPARVWKPMCFSNARSHRHYFCFHCRITRK